MRPFVQGFCVLHGSGASAGALERAELSAFLAKMGRFVLAALEPLTPREHDALDLLAEVV